MTDFEVLRDSIIIFSGMLVCLILGFCGGSIGMEEEIRQEAVNKNKAEWDKKTKEFKWLE